MKATISTAEAAKTLDITPRRVVQLIEKGIISASRDNGDYVMTSAELERAKRRPDGRKRKAGVK